MKMRKDKNEKRRLTLEKRNVKHEKNMTMYGAGSGAAVVVGKTVEFNRRLLAAFLALVFVLTTLVVGVNVATKAQGAKDEQDYGMMETVDPETGMVLRKGYLQTAGKDTPDNLDDDVYSLKLEAYATKDTTKTPLDTNNAKTPLDIVMVMNQTASMVDNKDVLKDKEAYQASSKPYFTISDIEHGDYYYCVETNGIKNYYPVSFTDRDETVKESYVVAKENGIEKTSWTAQEARGWVESHGKSLYYKNVTDADNHIFEFEKVWVTANTWYKNAGSSIDVTNFIDRGVDDLLGMKYNNGDIKEYYYNSSEDIYKNEPVWHPVHENTRGVYRGGYYIYLWYYLDESDAPTINDEGSYNKNISKIASVPNPKAYRKTDYSNGPYDAWSVGALSWKNAPSGSNNKSQSYLGGQLYTKQPATNKTPVNYLFTSNGTNGVPEIRRLAWPNVATESQSSVDSISWTGNFYTPGYLMYYNDNNYIGTAVADKEDVFAYTVDEENGFPKLYEKEKITRLEVQQLAANKFAEQIAANIGDRDYRIAVVGNADSGTIYSGNQTVEGAYVTTKEDVQSAVAALTNANANATALSDGLLKAADVFAVNKLDPADSRKRIVIVFGDSDTWVASNNDVTRNADAVLKDTYNASVYTIGLFNNTPDETFLSQMSSEYFFSVANASTTGAYKKMDGTYHYIANGDVFPDEANSMISTFGTVATETSESPTTEFVLDKTTAVLKDIIHENFNMPDNPDASTNVKVAVAQSYNADGEPNWGAAQDSGIDPKWEGTTLTVTGFDYDANYVSKDRPASAGNGEKIIITIDNLTVNQRVRTESKSAKRIYFNGANSGIYKTGAEELVVNKFPRPFLDDETMLAPEGGTGKMSKDGVVVNKYLTPTENGTYDLTVEAYTTRTSSETIEKVPTDFIVVADQSGSMSESDMPTGYKKVTGTKTLEQIASGKYYVLGDDGQYYRVYGTRNYMWRYYPANYFYVGDLIERFSARLSWFQSPKETPQTITNQMFFREVKDGQTYYQPISMTVQGKVGTYYIKFGFDSVKTGQHYMFDRKNTAYSSNGISPWYKSALGNVYNSGAIYRAAHAAVSIVYDNPNAYTYSQFMGANTGMFINYPMYDRHVGYNQLLYRDANGTEHVISATTGQKNYEFCDDSGHALTSQTGKEPTYSGLYEATGYQTRLEALQNALKEFAQAVADESHFNNQAVDNRIAIVGFSSPAYSTYNNTEILTGENLNVSGKNGKQIDQAQPDDYATALVSATDGNVGTVNTKITDAIDALSAYGGTQPEDGLKMAYSILANRSKKTYKLVTGEKAGQDIDRNTIVIYFTDGRPGDYTTINQYKEANDVVEAAKDIKKLKNSDLSTTNTYPSVFSIGVFGESDGNPLTYTAYEKKEANAEYEYELGWTETFRYKNNEGEEYGNYYYLNRNWRSGSPADYGSTASDTIYDYMSVVSSNYPDATKYMKVKTSNTAGEADLADHSNYLDMINSVRGTYSGNNDYYRMASNQATLVAAFSQAVTMMNQTISSEDRLDAAAVMQDVFNNTDFNVEDGYSIRATTVNGKMDKYGTVNFDESSEAPAAGVITNLKNVNGKQTMTVTGFDYLTNYINYGFTDPDTGAVTPKNDGKKLVVTISNVVPTVTGDKFYSNISENNASSMYVNNRTVAETDFPRPAISRHRYTLDVGDVNPNATFTVAMKVLDGNGQEVLKDVNSMADVILVYPNGTRKLYSQVGAQEFLQVANGQSFYLENLPKGYQVQTEVTSTDDAYIYSIWFDEENVANPKQMTKGTPEPKTFTYDDHTIHIKSKRGTKDVSVRERTIGSYGDTTHRFGEVITMEIPVIRGETLVKEFPCTFNKDFSGFDSELPKNATNFKAVFTDETPDATDTKVAKLTAITYTNSDGTPGTWNLENCQLPMRDGDVITFQNVPTGNTVKAVEPDTYEHDVFYYYGQDDVSPSGIKLMTTNGDLLAGTHTLTFKEVDGLEKDRLEVTFENGSITKVNGDAVKTGDTIDFAKYQTMYVIDEGNDDLSDAKLNFDGTEVYFSTETEDEKTAYVATIKRETFDPPVSVTVEKNNMDILIINERGDIEIEGIFDSNHNVIIYILAGAGALALAAGGYYVWRKRDELTAID